MKADRRTVLMAALLMTAFTVVPAGEEQDQPPSGAKEEAVAGEQEPAAREPDHIRVQHILIGFQGSARATSATRSAEEARALAYEILERARGGEDYDALVKEYTDDRPPGIYAMANHGVQLRPPPPREYPRGGMVPAFGDVGFRLAVGEVGIADFDPKKSPYGYHIIKRIE